MIRINHKTRWDEKMTKVKDCAVLILAAGKGSRMKSNKPKVMHDLAGAPLIHYVMASALELQPVSLHTIIAPGMEGSVGQAVAPNPICLQTEQKGTGHAVMQAKDVLKEFKGTVLILLGDVPLIRTETLHQLTRTLETQKNTIQLLTFQPEDPTGYGRVLTEEDESVTAIVEHKDCDPRQLLERRVWSGCMAVDGEKLFELLDQISDENAQNEYYLTSIVEVARAQELTVGFLDTDTFQVQGINSKQDLARIEQQVQQMLRHQHLDLGVTLQDPESTYFSIDTKIGADCIIEPHVYFGRGVEVGDSCHIRAFSHIEGAKIGAETIIGPFARLRPDTVLAGKNDIGNFVEIKKTTVGTGSKVKHLSYIGDATIGEKANLGAGTITCNYNGYEKFKTTIGDHAFTGVNSVLVAPCEIGAQAITAAGSVITEPVKEGALAIARAHQTNKEGWATAFHTEKQKLKSKKAS